MVNTSEDGMEISANGTTKNIGNIIKGRGSNGENLSNIKNWYYTMQLLMMVQKNMDILTIIKKMENLICC